MAGKHMVGRSCTAASSQAQVSRTSCTGIQPNLCDRNIELGFQSLSEVEAHNLKSLKML